MNRAFWRQNTFTLNKPAPLGAKILWVLHWKCSSPFYSWSAFWIGSAYLTNSCLFISCLWCSWRARPEIRISKPMQLMHAETLLAKVQNIDENQISSRIFTHLATQQSARSTNPKSTHPSPLWPLSLMAQGYTVLAPSPNLVGDPLISTTKHHFGAILN